MHMIAATCMLPAMSIFSTGVIRGCVGNSIIFNGRFLLWSEISTSPWVADETADYRCSATGSSYFWHFPVAAAKELDGTVLGKFAFGDGRRMFDNDLKYLNTHVTAGTGYE